MKRIIRQRYLTPEESAKYQKIRDQVAQELPELIARYGSNMKTYQGTRTGIQEQNTAGDAVVTVREGDSSYRLKETEVSQRHSPTGFNWGYGGSGPAALAHAILADCFGVSEADRLHQYFKAQKIATLKQSSNFEITEQEIRAWAVSECGPTLEECAICDMCHPLGFFGDCRDDKNRYTDAEDYAKRNRIDVKSISVLTLSEDEK